MRRFLQSAVCYFRLLFFAVIPGGGTLRGWKLTVSMVCCLPASSAFQVCLEPGNPLKISKAELVYVQLGKEGSSSSPDKVIVC